MVVVYTRPCSQRLTVDGMRRIFCHLEDDRPNPFDREDELLCLFFTLENIGYPAPKTTSHIINRLVDSAVQSSLYRGLGRAGCSEVDGGAKEKSGLVLLACDSWEVGYHSPTCRPDPRALPLDCRLIFFFSRYADNKIEGSRCLGYVAVT